jgi:GR25 family glycosyltransferase involved in LPS biosynthesis
METFKMNCFPFPVNRFSALTSSCGEDGCTNSHLSILKKQKEFPFAVFEDDCLLIQPWKIVEKAISQLPNDCDALWLGANLRQPLERYSNNLFRLKKAWCLHGVIYFTQRIVDYILENHNTPSGINIDTFYCKDVQYNFNCFIVSPMVTVQCADFSDIAKKKTNNYVELIDNYRRYTK